MKGSLLTILILVCLAVPQAFAQHDLSDDAKEHYNRGHEFYKQGKHDDAILEFSKALEHNPEDAPSLFGLGNSYFLKQDFAKAIKCYQGVVKIKPDFAKAHYALALAYRRVGKIEDAEREFDLYNRLSAQKPAGKPAEAPRRAERPKPAGAPKPTVKRLEPKREVAEEAAPQRPAVKRLEPEKRVVTEEEAPRRPEVVRKEPEKRTLPEEVLRRARPAEREERVGLERPPARKPVTVVQKPAEERKNFVSRTIRALKDWGPPGKFLLWTIYYTLAVQVWITIVILFGLIILWRRR